MNQTQGKKKQVMSTLGCGVREKGSQLGDEKQCLGQQFAPVKQNLELSLQ